MAARINRDAVLAELRATDVIVAFGLRGQARGDEFRTRHCPMCGPRSRDAVAINLASGKWSCHAHGCSGDIFALVAALSGLDIGRDFPAVLTRAAEIAGVMPSDDAADAGRRIERERQEQERQEREALEERERRAAAIVTASAHWERMSARSPNGEAYLATRGLADAVARELVRFESDGDIAAPLYTADGQIVNVVRRRLAGREPKVWGLADCPTKGTMVGSLRAITGAVPAIVVEGLADALTAALAWPTAVVLGAHGAGRMALIAEHAARRVRLAGGRLWLGCHADDAGESATERAGRAAIAVGLRFGVDLSLIDHGEAPDLNDAWCAGWRPSP